jgi:hypothetical protein
MRDSGEKKCVTGTIVAIVVALCVVLGIAIYAVSRPTTSDVHLTSANTTSIPHPDLLTKTANIATNTMRPIQSIISSDADDTDLSGI